MNKDVELTPRNLKNNRGMVVFRRSFLTDHPTEGLLRALFLNFFPVAMENDHTQFMYDGVKMYGYSPHFRELREGEATPEYEIVLINDENGVRFDSVSELKY